MLRRELCVLGSLNLTSTFFFDGSERRVRYFVRHWEMPCHEAPTEQEGYIFHMVTDDLYNDPDLSDTERVAIRGAMFDGKLHCKT